MSGFIDKDVVIMQEVGNNEFSVNILRLVCVEFGQESDISLVVHPLEVVLLGTLGQQTVDMTQRVFFVTETIVRGNLLGRILLGLGLGNITNGIVITILFHVVLMGEGITSQNVELSAIEVQVFIRSDLKRSDKFFGYALSWLIKIELLGELLSLHKEREGVSSTVGGFDFSNLNAVVSQIVMDDVRDTALTEESQHLSVILQELFL